MGMKLVVPLISAISGTYWFSDLSRLSTRRFKMSGVYRIKVMEDNYSPLYHWAMQNLEELRLEVTNIYPDNVSFSANENGTRPSFNMELKEIGHTGAETIFTVEVDNPLIDSFYWLSEWIRMYGAASLQWHKDNELNVEIECDYHTRPQGISEESAEDEEVQPDSSPETLISPEMHGKVGEMAGGVLTLD